MTGFYELFGFPCREDARDIADLEFPIEAYKVFCSKLNMPWPFEDVSPLNVVVHPSDEQKQTIPFDENGVEVIKGITVGEMRQYLNQDSEEFLPRLLALLVAKKRVVKERNGRDAQGFRLHKGDKEWAKSVASEEYEKLFGTVNGQDEQAIARCLMRDVKPLTGKDGSY